MATLVLGAIGTLIGGPIGGSIGTLIGRSLVTKIFGGGAREGPRLSELRLTTSSYGAPIPRQFGRMRVAGQIIWATDLIEQREKQGGGKGGPSVSSYTYSASFAVALSSRPLLSVGRIWADGKLLRGEAGDLKVGGAFRLHLGHGDQAPDPLLAAAEDLCPAYRGLAYAVFEDLQLNEYGNRIPSLSFEVFADEAPLELADLTEGVVDSVSAAVPLTGIAGLSNEGALAETLAALDPFFPVDCDACNEQLVLSPDRRDWPAIALPEAATSSSSDDFGGNAGFNRQRGGDPEAPVAVLRYYDLDRDYQPGAQRTPGRPLPGQPRTIELPATLTASAARSLVEQAARRAQWNRQTVQWRVTQLDPAVHPGATVTLTGHPGLWRVRGWEWREHGVDLTLARMTPFAESGSFSADPGRASQAPDLALASTSLIVCELPWDGNSGTPVPLIMALPSSASANWPGASLYVDQGDGLLQPLGPSGRTRATIGAAVTQLAASSPMLLDRHGQVEVDLVGSDMALTNATMRQLAMGANRALIGSEIIQFAVAAPLGGGRWRLSGLWRGRGGTESAIGSHQIGEAFVVLDGTCTPLNAEAVGTVPGTLIAAIGLADSAPVTAPILLSGIAHRSPSPVHGTWSRRPDGAHVLHWTRRARGGWLWQDGVDVPLAEQTEAYEVTFGLPASPYARWDLATTELALTPGELTQLTAAGPGGQFAIRQRGDRAASEPLSVAAPQP